MMNISIRDQILSNTCFKEVPYLIRIAEVKDIKFLELLEDACWPPELKISTEDLIERISLSSYTNFVQVLNSNVVAVIYTQKITNINEIKNYDFQTIKNLNNIDGSIIQILALNVNPKYQDQSLGNSLLTFALEYFRLSGFTKVVGVTRCKNYEKYNNISYEDYIHSRNMHGVLLDPVLHYHETHGASIKKAIKNYRREDKRNLGYGVLVKYNLNSDKYKENVRTILNANNMYDQVLTNFYYSESESEINLVQEIMVNEIMAVFKEFDYEKDKNKTFMEIGLDSSELLILTESLNKKLKTSLKSYIFYAYNTPEALYKHLVKLSNLSTKTEISSSSFDYSQNRCSYTTKGTFKDEKIAVIGMSVKTPGNCNDLASFWNLLKEGAEGISELPSQRKILGCTQNTRGGFLSDISCFDSIFFNISPKEAQGMDPQQRLLLEMHWEAMESAGILASELKDSKTGVFIGLSSHDYEKIKMKNKMTPDSFSSTGTSNSIAAGRISYFFDLKGPAMVIDTACSSSLVAVYEACMSLIRNETNLAFGSGINLILSEETSINYQIAGMLSKTNKCWAFDACADGYVRSEGAGVVLFKRYSDAIRDGDNILAVIIGGAINQDGKSNGLTAPDLNSQINLYKSALESSGISPNEIDFIEAHGTGTILGDAVECESICKVYGNLDKRILITALKTQIGHAEAGAGVLGLIKVILSLLNKKIPGCINFQKLSPQLAHLSNVMEIVGKEGKFIEKNKREPIRCGVSSFGFSGTNAHLILQEKAICLTEDHEDSKNYYEENLYISAKTKKNLLMMVKAYLNFIKLNRELSLKKIFYTINKCREKFKYCLIVNIKENSLDNLVETLANAISHFPSGVVENFVKKDDLCDSKLSRCEIIYNFPTYSFEKKKHWIRLDQDSVSSISENLKFIKPDKNSNENISLDLSLSTMEEIKNLIIQLLSKLTNREEESIDENEGFINLGLDSMLLQELRQRVCDYLNFDYTTISSSTLFQYSNASNLAKFLWSSKTHLKSTKIKNNPKVLKNDSIHEVSSLRAKIGVVGFSCRYGSANSPEEFWNILVNGSNTVTEIPKDRFDIESYFSSDVSIPGKIYTRHASFLNNIDLFDASFFSINSKEAKMIDPQHRILVEVAYEALERAGIAPSSIFGTKTGIYIGLTWNEYGSMINRNSTESNPYLCSGNSYATASGRLSYIFGTLGPSMTIDTACSSSLTALHLGIAALEANEIELAICGGVNLLLSPEPFINLCKARMLSVDGVTYSFDGRASGYARGEGCGVVILKKCIKTMENSFDLIKTHEILATVSSTCNSDGRTSGFTVPNGKSQEDLIKSGLIKANLKPEDITLIEAHATSTALGDPIEVEALMSVFQNDGGHKIYLSSSKANFNHTEAAAGICGLIKVILCIVNKLVTPQANFKMLNKNISGNFYDTFIVPTQIEPLVSKKIRGGVSSFGFSGTNVFVIVEELKESENKNFNQNNQYFQHLIVVSAKSEYSLQHLIEKYLARIQNLNEKEFIDFIYTCNTSRSFYKKRISILAKSKSELIDRLNKKSYRRPSEDKNIISYNVSILNKISDANFSEILKQCLIYDEFNIILNQALQILKRNNRDLDNNKLGVFILEYCFFKMMEEFNYHPKSIKCNKKTILLSGVLSGKLTFEIAVSLILMENNKGEKMDNDNSDIPISDGLKIEYYDKVLSNQKYKQILNQIDTVNKKDFGISFTSPIFKIFQLVEEVWLSGANPNFEKLYRPFSLQKVIIPTYSFEKSKYWAECLQKNENIFQKISSYFYKESWIEFTTVSNIHTKLKLVEEKSSMKKTLIILNQSSLLYDLRTRQLCFELERKRKAFTLFIKSAFTSPTQEHDDIEKSNISKRNNFFIDIEESNNLNMFFTKFKDENHIFDEIHYILPHITNACDLNFDLLYQTQISLIKLLKELNNLSLSPRIFVVTFNSSTALNRNQTIESNVNFFSYPIWAMIRTISREDSNVKISGLDIDIKSINDYIKTVDFITNIENEKSNKIEIQIALRDSQLYVPRLLPLHFSLEKNIQTLIFDKRKSYLITGGLGGIGLRLCNWLLCKGATSIVLVSRNAPNLETMDYIKSLESQFSQANITHMKGNISDYAIVLNILQKTQDIAPVDGIFHAAGTLIDDTFINITYEKIKLLHEPKAKGAWNFHNGCKELKIHLSHFVLFSSISSSLGPIGKANYAASNAFLNSLALYRQKLNLPCLSINWGAWGEFGMAAKDPAFGENNKGIKAFSFEAGLAALELLINDNIEIMPIFCNFDWPRWQKQYCWDRLWLSETESKGFLSVENDNNKSKTVELTRFMANFYELDDENDRKVLISNSIKDIVQNVSESNKNDISEEDTFSYLGIDSIMLLDVQEKIQNLLGDELILPITLAFNFTTIKRISSNIFNALLKNKNDAKKDVIKESSTKPANSSNEIAIIGMSCRLPGNIKTPLEFWKVLCSGKSVISEVPISRYDINKIYDPIPGKLNKTNCKYGGFMADIDKFDNEFFKINQREANLLDPQHRILLELSYEALENAGLQIDKLEGSNTGIFVGISNNDYGKLLLENKNDIASEYDHIYTFTGNSLSTAAGRISHIFNFSGPAMSIDTACSSSLVSVYLGVQSLLAHESDLALASGVNLILSPDNTLQVSKASMLSSSNMCTFDANADGFIRSEGAGVVVLKRLEDAIKDNDSILATIASCCVNHDGASATLTSPSILSQKNLLNKTLSRGNINPLNVDFIETHGTSTKIGDPIEVSALRDSAYGESRKLLNSPIVLGACKTVIGHTESASGVISLIKAVLCLQNNYIPPNLNFDALNSLIKNDDNLFVMINEGKIWKKKGVKMAGVSSFGMSGTNSHLVVKEFYKDNKKESKEKLEKDLFVISAKSEEALNELLKRYIEYLKDDEHSLVTFNDICYTSRIGRTHYKHRVACIASSKKELIEKLNNFNATDSKLNSESKHQLNLPEMNDFKHNELEKILNLYISNNDFDFKKHDNLTTSEKILLQNYPFKKHHCWAKSLKNSFINPNEDLHVKKAENLTLKLSKNSKIENKLELDPENLLDESTHIDVLLLAAISSFISFEKKNNAQDEIRTEDTFFQTLIGLCKNVFESSLFNSIYKNQNTSVYFNIINKDILAPQTQISRRVRDFFKLNGAFNDMEKSEKEFLEYCLKNLNKDNNQCLLGSLVINNLALEEANILFLQELSHIKPQELKQKIKDTNIFLIRSKKEDPVFPLPKSEAKDKINKVEKLTELIKILDKKDISSFKSITFMNAYQIDTINAKNFDASSPLMINSKITIAPKVVFLFTGQGSQYSGMGQELYNNNPRFRELLNLCSTLLLNHLENQNIIDIMFKPELESLLNQTKYAQPCLFALEYALATLLLENGIIPKLLIGHSLGEIVASVISKVLSLEDGVKLISERGKLIQSLPLNEGGMVAASINLQGLKKLLSDNMSDLDVAANNSIAQTVVSGSKKSIKKFVEILRKNHIRCTELNVSHAFHSKLLGPIVEKFRLAANTISYHKATIPIISNLTGEIQENFSSEYWVSHLTSPVLFFESIKKAIDLGGNGFIEIGPKVVLIGFGHNIIRNHHQENLKITWTHCYEEIGSIAK